MNRPPTPDAVEDQSKELSLQEIINIKVVSLPSFCYNNLPRICNEQFSGLRYFFLFLIVDIISS